MKSKFNINNVFGSAIMIAILFANIAPVAVYAEDGDFGYSDSSYSYDSGYSDSAYNYGSGYTDSNYNYGSGYSDSAYNYSTPYIDTNYNYGSGYTDSNYNYTPGYSDSSYNYSSPYTDSSYNYGSGYTDSNYNYSSPYTDSSYNYSSPYTDSSYNYGSGYTDSNYNYASPYTNSNYNYGSGYTNSGYNYSQPTAYTTGQAQTYAQQYAQPSYSQPQQSYSQPRVTTPTYSTPSYSQPRITTPTYTTPTYTIPQTPIYIPQPTPVPQPQPQTCNITIVPTQLTITKGNYVNISWTSTNASYVTLTGGIYSNTRVSNSGTYKVYPTVNTTYTVRCVTAQGLSNTASSYITVTQTTINQCTNGATNYPYCFFPTPTPTPTPVPTQNVTVSTTGGSAYCSSATLYGYVNSYNSNATIYYEYGTSASNLQYQTTKQNTSISGQFSGNLSGLNQSTRYYYRAVATNGSYPVYGQTLSFVTSNCGGTTADNSVITRLATSVSYYNAQLNGAFIKGDVNTQSCQSFFDYGTNYNLSTRTTGQALYPNASVSYFSQAVSGLTPNTTYYVRAGATCYNGTKYGNIVSFKTPAIKYTYTGGKKTVYTYNYVAPKTEVKETPTCLCDTQTYLSLVIENIDGATTIGKLVNYKVVYKNTSKDDLKNVAIRVILPDEMTIYGAEKGQYTKGGKTLIYTIDSLKSTDEGSFVVTGLVSNNTQIGRQMVINGYANYSVPTVVKAGVPLTGEVTAYVVSTVDNGTGMNPANDDSGMIKNTNTSTTTWFGFLPSTLVDWIIFLIVFLIFLAALRYVFTTFSRNNY